MNKLFGCVLWMPTVVYQDFETVEEKESGIFEVSDSLNSTLISESDDSRLYVSMIAILAIAVSIVLAF